MLKYFVNADEAAKKASFFLRATLKNLKIQFYKRDRKKKNRKRNIKKGEKISKKISQIHGNK